MPDKKTKSMFSLFSKKKKKADLRETAIPDDNLMSQKDPLAKADTLMADLGSTVTTLLGSDRRPARSRSAIYEKWSDMESDPFVSAALRLHCTAALAGDQASGDAVYIETKAAFEKDKSAVKLVEELQDLIQPLVNNVDQAVSYNALAFGDAYARVYSDSKQGVHHLLVDETLRPSLIQPFERAGKTVGFVAYSGDKPLARLTVRQIARMKMSRGTAWVPQHNVIEKSIKMALTEDDLNKSPILPSMVGGSILYTAEEPYNDLRQSLVGLVGQRWVDSMDEQILGLNMESMSGDQGERYLESIKSMLRRSKALAEESMNGKPVMERIRHIVPFFSEKQMFNVMDSGGGRQSTISTEDIMFHAKSLAASLGVDLSQIGFSEILSGGLGEGGFFRNSAQVAEASANVRKAFADFVNNIIDIHTWSKYGVVYPPNKRPWKISFFGSISALENEKQNTRLQAMNAGSMLVGAIQQCRDMGMTDVMIKLFLTNEMMLDESDANTYAEIANIKPEGEEGGGFGEEGGGFDEGDQDIDNDGEVEIEETGTGEGQKGVKDKKPPSNDGASK